ncbi:MAG: dihydroxy-acid dehydratase, partial [Dehalococcoidia bacterium]
EGMKTSLITREVIADSVELVALGQRLDGLVTIAGCDKSLPGMLMGLARVNIPSIFLYGGTIMPGKVGGKDVTIQDVFEAVGSYSRGQMSKEELRELECRACPAEGSCAGLYTANTMAAASEALGMSPPGSGTVPAVDPHRKEVCQETGVEIANVNSDDQIVISGDRIALARAMDLASARGARKTIPLAVAGAFHSQLMASAQEGLCQALGQTTFREPKAPIVANLSGQKLTTGEEIKEELKNQLCNCVRWKQSVECMIDMGVSTFVEFGPGRVLTSLVKRIDRQAKTANVGDVDSAQKVAVQSSSL